MSPGSTALHAFCGCTGHIYAASLPAREVKGLSDSERSKGIPLLQYADDTTLMEGQQLNKGPLNPLRTIR